MARQANTRDGRAGERTLPYEVWARNLKQHTEVSTRLVLLQTSALVLLLSGLC